MAKVSAAFLVVLGVGLVILAVVLRPRSVRDGSAPGHAPKPGAAVASISSMATAARSSGAEPTSSVAPAAAEPVGAAATSPAPPIRTRGAPTRDGSPDLSLERELVERAARSLAAGDATAALRILGDYQQRCPRRILDEEAAFLRVRALVALGRTAEASEIARRLRRDHPGTLYSKRIEVLLDGERAR
jgi:hypothetical protein